MTDMDITIQYTFLPHTDAEASLARSWARLQSKRTGLDHLPQREQATRIEVATAALAGGTAVSPLATPPHPEPNPVQGLRSAPRVRP